MPEPSLESPASRDRYVVVARRYRPKGFDQLVGQEHVGRALKNAIETNRVGHAYLFTGARGVGKTSTARIFAKALNAPEGPTPYPDNESDICQAIDSGEDVDVLEIDGASNRGIDEIRSLRAGVGIRPSRSRFKIYIIDEVHMLTQAAFNALLKTLEEPPEHVKFIFCTTDPEKLPITVLSRCQRFDFAPVQSDQIMGRLREIVDAEGTEADDQALQLIARRAAGSMRDSQSLLEQVMSFSSGRLTVETVHAMLGTADDERLSAIAAALIQRDAASALVQVDAAVAAGVDAGQLAEQLLGHFRDLMTASVGCDADMLRYTGATMHGELKQRGQQWGLATVLAVVGLLDHTLVRIRQSMHGRVLLETALVQICHLPDMQRVADLIDGLTVGRSASAPSEKKNASLPSARLGESPAAAAPAADRAPAGGSSSAVDSAPPRLGPPPPPHWSSGPSSATAGTAMAAAQGVDRAAATAAPASRQTRQPADPPPPSRRAGGVSAAPQATRRNGTPVPWTDADVQKFWADAVAELDDLTADLARQALRVEAAGEGKVKVFYGSDQGLTKSSCENPERKSKLEAALSRVAARDVHVETAFDARPAARVATSPPPGGLATRRQRQRELQGDPFVQQCVELFGAEVLRVDERR